MSHDFFKELVRRIKSDFLYGIPEGEWLSIYHKSYGDGEEIIMIDCGKCHYFTNTKGKEEYKFSEGQSDAE